MKIKLLAFGCLCILYISGALALPTLLIPKLSYQADASNSQLPQMASIVSQIGAAVKAKLINSRQFTLVAITDNQTMLATLESTSSESIAPAAASTTKIAALNAGASLNNTTMPSGSVVNQAATPDTAADYTLLGNITDVAVYKNDYPIPDTNNISKQCRVEITADFKLIHNSNKQIMADFLAHGKGYEVKVIANAPDTMWHCDINKLLAIAERNLAKHVNNALNKQLSHTLPGAKPYNKPAKGQVVTDVQVYK